MDEGEVFRQSKELPSRKHLFHMEFMVKRIEVDADVLLQSFTFDPENVRLLDVVARIQFSDFLSVEIDNYGHVERGLTQKWNLESVSTTTLDLEKSPMTSPSMTDIDERDIFPAAQGGKSCLFPMSPETLVEEVTASPIYVDVFTKDETAIFLGKTKIRLGANFLDVISSSQSCTDLPISAFMRCSLPVYSIFGDVSGLIEMYVRLSCFGKSILSDFSHLHCKEKKDEIFEDDQSTGVLG